MIRRMEIKDADRVYEIENASFFEPWTKKNLIKELTANSLLKHYVYELDGEIVGFYIASKVLDLVEIFTIAVDEDFRKRGIGRKLLSHLIENSKASGAREIWLEVSVKNFKAIELYEKFGFEKDGIRKNYYQKLGEDAYNMKRKLYE
ncbi:MAG: ribosomal protein S18-alanine N-acetyltransferase [Anaerococcus prevotii]|nr:ribosomal protein S18-alanine N-acetyltransferase [Anaerococcus prevotii]